MPKITSHYHKGYRVSVSYQTKRQVFTIILPEDLKHYGLQVDGATEVLVKKQFDNLVEKFLLEGVDRQKVIVINAEDNSPSSGFVNDDFYRSGGSTARLAIQWLICERIMVNGEYKFRCEENFGGTKRYSNFHGGSRYKSVPWTAEREDFLKSLTSSLDAIAVKAKGFFDQENLELKIDSRPKLLQ